MLPTLLFLSLQSLSIEAATCGGGHRGDGICPQIGLCCSQWGWCGSTGAYCGPPATTTKATTDGTSTAASSTRATATPGTSEQDSRLIAYVGNWQACPTNEKVKHYTHIVIAFAVSYTWSPSKNVCSPTCDIATPPVCNNAANPGLIQQWQDMGKKVILSFGGAGMGGSWAGDVNDCWDYCFGRQDQVSDRLVSIVESMGLDGVDLDYEYFYEDNQNGSGFTKGAQARQFLTEMTLMLRQKLPSDSEITHAPMDVDMQPGKAYYEILVHVAPFLDYLMPQYYNGVTRPVLDGIDETGSGSVSTLSHYRNLVDNMFGGDATRIVFGFCISDCGSTGSNANANQATKVMTDLAESYSCNGGAFFWVASHDLSGSWSSQVNAAIAPNTGCSSVPSSSTTGRTQSIASTSSVSSTAATTPSTTSSAIGTTSTAVTVTATTTPNREGSCEIRCDPNESRLKAYDGCTKYYRCAWGQIAGNLVQRPTDKYLFDQTIQNWNWAWNVQCQVPSC